AKARMKTGWRCSSAYMTIMKLTARTPKRVTAFTGTTLVLDAVRRLQIENLLAELDASIADVDAGTSYEPPDLILAFPHQGCRAPRPTTARLDAMRQAATPILSIEANGLS